MALALSELTSPFNKVYDWHLFKSFCTTNPLWFFAVSSGWWPQWSLKYIWGEKDSTIIGQIRFMHLRQSQDALLWWKKRPLFILLLLVVVVFFIYFLLFLNAYLFISMFVIDSSGGNADATIRLLDFKWRVIKRHTQPHHFKMNVYFLKSLIFFLPIDRNAWKTYWLNHFYKNTFHICWHNFNHHC